MSTLQLSRAKFRKSIFKRYKELLRPYYYYGCDCSDCKEEQGDEILGDIPRGWRSLLEDLLHDLHLLYAPEHGIWKLKHQGFEAGDSGFMVSFQVQNTNNKKQCFKTKTYAHKLLLAVNKRCLSSCVSCGKAPVKNKKMYPWYSGLYPVCKAHTKIKSIPY